MRDRLLSSAAVGSFVGSVDPARGPAWQGAALTVDDLHVAFTGRLDNAADLRAALHAAGNPCAPARAPADEGDAQIVARGYQVWGDEAVDRLRGAYAFALWDQQRRRLLAARDPLGRAQLVYAARPRRGAPPGFVVSSSLRALRGWVSGAVDPVGLAQYLALGFVPAPATILADVRQLAPGARLVLDLAGDPQAPPRLIPAPPPPPPVDGAVSADALADAIATLLPRAVERQLAGAAGPDGRVALWLSGGAWSTALAPVLAGLLGGGARVRALTMVLTGASDDEAQAARAAALRLGIAHEAWTVDPDALDGGALAAALDEPVADPRAWRLAELTRETRLRAGEAQGRPVVLSGHGAAALFTDAATTDLAAVEAAFAVLRPEGREAARAAGPPAPALAPWDAPLAALRAAAGARSIEVRTPYLDDELVTLAGLVGDRPPAAAPAPPGRAPKVSPGPLPPGLAALLDAPARRLHDPALGPALAALARWLTAAP
jgi:asparagine synthase (glutamine-hydrolysing)